MLQIRQLAAIMFTDIVGYTALMGEDEKKAFDILTKNRQIQKPLIEQFNGRWIKELGDGVLASFPTATDAVFCAIQIQKACTEIEDLKLRIGIHLGEIVFEIDDVFGDGVNIASRIQSLGTPGSILISKAIRDQIKNQADFLLISVGSFHFKNVDEPMEVFALANPGFVVPKREELQGKLKTALRKGFQKRVSAGIVGVLLLLFVIWYLVKSSVTSPLSKETREKAIAVMSFENNSQDKSLDAFGLMAKDWLSQALLETGKARVIKENDGSAVLNENSSKTAQIPKGAEILIRGRYYFENNQLALTSEIIDAKANTIIYSLKPIVGERSNPMKLIDELKQKIVGYWVLGNQLLGKTPPKYNAYEAFLQGVNSSKNKKEKYLIEAIALDSTFLSPYFALINYYINATQGRLADSLMAVLSTKERDFTEYEKLKWESVNARVGGDFLRSAELGWELYERYHIEQGASQAIFHYRAKNYLNKAIEKYYAFKPVALNPAESYTDQIYIGEAFDALENLGKYDSVLNWIARLPYPVLDVDIAMVHLQALIRKNRMGELDSWLEKYKSMPLQGHTYFTIPILYWRVCVDLFILNRKEDLNKYLNKFEKVNLEHPEGMFYHYYKGVIAYMKKDYSKAYEHTMQYFRSKPSFVLFTEFPAVCLVKMGKKEAAIKWMEDLKKKGSSYPGQWEYGLGVIEFHLSNVDEALRLIESGFNKGYDFNFYSYRDDFLLKDFMNYPRYREFTEPK